MIIALYIPKHLGTAPRAIILLLNRILILNS